MKRVVLFSGGSACRSLNNALCREDVSLTRIVPAWDSGGSSRTIRLSLDMLSVGDIRQALMTMAHGEKRSGDVVRICNTRLSSDLQSQDARTEFTAYLEGYHPLLERLEPGLRGAIVNYLKTFAAEAGNTFDYRNGSIGNFILSGAYLAHNRDINTAIFVFRKLCGISGNVWPSSLCNDLILSATLNDGKIVSPQDQITKMAESDASTGIKNIELRTSDGHAPGANPVVLEAIRDADLIVFGPGSFYTSILPHLQVEGITSAVSQSGCPVVFISNILQCKESLGLGLREVSERFEREWKTQSSNVALPVLYLFGNRRFLAIDKYVNGFAYLSDEVSECEEYRVVLDEFEDVWERGKHDGTAVAAKLLALTDGSVLSL
ncbi:YvcK family protein [Kluyvera sp. EC_51]|uniref:gluconeogenesis factor YvcK family protein n=1 Tax=Kluyvera sp. EC_51 TaxID=2584089 RepID=UPI001C6FD9CF|nr:gluconeogenesis factor YvcK family protein [Kluyvera sp. EC_51]MBW9462343.1 YvcK family protein [Kluyvera sp. EC_51]